MIFKTVETRVRESMQAMIHKNLFPKRSVEWFTEPHMKQLTKITKLQKFKEWSCPICGITVYGPKKALIEHHKIHGGNRDIKENEHYRLDYKLY